MQTKKAHYEKFSQPASRFALVGCAVATDANGGNVRIAFTGVSDTPYLDKKAQEALDGKSIDENSIASAVAAMDTSVYVMSDHYANEKYRRHLAGVMMSRALEAIS
jgi:carbon-monoxide dehydrogenase medium subunit